MITVNNYFEKIKSIEVNSLPPTLRETHDYVVQATENGSSWSNYHNSEKIRRLIDLHFQKINEFLSSTEEKQQSPNPSPKLSKKSKVSAESKAQPGKKEGSPMHHKQAKGVEHIREEVKFIKRYVGLHNKVKAPSAILSFIKALQRSIVQKLIRKTSPLAAEIEMINFFEAL